MIPDSVPGWAIIIGAGIGGVVLVLGALGKLNGTVVETWRRANDDWRKARADSEDAEIADLRREVHYLTGAVTDLRDRIDRMDAEKTSLYRFIGDLTRWGHQRIHQILALDPDAVIPPQPSLDEVTRRPPGAPPADPTPNL